MTTLIVPWQTDCDRSKTRVRFGAHRSCRDVVHVTFCSLYVTVWHGLYIGVHKRFWLALSSSQLYIYLKETFVTFLLNGIKEVIGRVCPFVDSTYPRSSHASQSEVCRSLFGARTGGDPTVRRTPLQNDSTWGDGGDGTDFRSIGGRIGVKGVLWPKEVTKVYSSDFFGSGSRGKV